MKQMTRIFWRAFLDGFTMAGLFRCLDYPGAPRLFVDEDTCILCGLPIRYGDQYRDAYAGHAHELCFKSDHNLETQ